MTEKRGAFIVGTHSKERRRIRSELFPSASFSQARNAALPKRPLIFETHLSVLFWSLLQRTGEENLGTIWEQ
jgi:hypothetical protein